MFRELIKRIKEIRAESNVIATFTAHIEHGTLDAQSDAHILEGMMGAIVESIERGEGKVTIILVKQSKAPSEGTSYVVSTSDKIMFVKQTNAKTKQKSFIEELICLGAR